MKKLALTLFFTALLFGCGEYTQKDYDRDIEELRQLRKENQEWKKSWQDAWNQVERDSRPY